VGVFAGQDVNGDGVIDRRENGPDSVLAAQALAAKRALAELDQPGTRVALVTFSGAPYPGWEPDPRVRQRPPRLDKPQAQLERALGADLGEVERLVDELAARLPWGVTDMAAGLSTALAAFGSDSNGRDRVVLFFTDGTPTSPHAEPDANVDAALRTIPGFAQRRVRVHTFAIGMRALANPEVPIRIADATGGYFTPVESAWELAELARLIAGASVRDVRVRNRRTGDDASSVLVGHDGTWSALVPLALGENPIEITARSLGGREARRELVVVGRSPGPRQQLPDDLGAQHRDLLLRVRLTELQKRTAELAERLRRELTLRMEQVRTRRELEIRAEPPSEATGGDQPPPRE
jgi:hypothetical protein